MADEKKTTDTTRTPARKAAARAGNESVTVNLNSTYENNDTGQKVVPFHRSGDTIVYAPVGSGRENRTTWFPTKLGNHEGPERSH
jgi:hypothetical protein